ncbi:hypothetical protein M1D51_16155 [Arthrobacter sp. R3-55]
MDLLNGLSLEQLQIGVWAVAALFAFGAALWRPAKIHSTVFGAVLLFAGLNVGAGLYVLNHYADSRWSAEATSLTAPTFKETPLVGQFLEPLDAALQAVVSGVNDFLAFKEALPIALEFMVTAGWALLWSLPLMIFATIINQIIAKRRAATFNKYRSAVDLLREELDQLKLEVARRNADRVPGLATDVSPGKPQ